jgi:integrase
LDVATRADYAPILAFAHATGFRLKECLLRWSEVNFDTGQITKPGKKRRRVSTPITPTVQAILLPLRGHHPELVFTYVAKRKDPKRVKGERYPITYNGLKTLWKRTRKRAKVEDFRFHDFRHDLGSKVLRQTGNLKLVQRVLNHSDIKTTVRYAHVLDSDVAAALEQRAESRTKSRTAKREAS